LGDAIISVLSQKIENMEVLVIDDGSTDNPAAVVDSFADRRISMVTLPNGGVARARNAGLDRATGRYLAFLDADDRWRPGKLRRQIDLLESEPDVGMVFTNFVRFTPDGNYLPDQFSFIPQINRIHWRPSKDGDGMVILNESFAQLATLPIFATWFQTVVLRADRVVGIRFPHDVRLAEDSWYMYRVYARTNAAFLADPLVEVRRHGDNSYGGSSAMIEPEMTMFAHLVKEHFPGDQRRLLQNKLARSRIALGDMYAHRGERSAAARLSGHALLAPAIRVRASAIKHALALAGSASCPRLR
jgi:glycosyltransferase involved in cell wall biosynthesis